jgi:hypothetical protein
MIDERSCIIQARSLNNLSDHPPNSNDGVQTLNNHLPSIILPVQSLTDGQEGITSAGSSMICPSYNLIRTSYFLRAARSAALKK